MVHPVRLRDLLVICAGVLGAVSCASAPRPAVESDEPPEFRWTGSLQPTQQRSGALVVTGQNHAFGSVAIVPLRGNLERMRLTLNVSVPATSSAGLRWAVVPDRCGNGDLPLLGVDQFPLIEIGTNGRGSAQVDLPLQMAPNNAYHVNVYDGAAHLENVVTCANLKYEGRK
jgi:hypothetical protein